MKKTFVIAALAAAMVSAPVLAADPAPAAAATAYSVEATDIGTLLDNPATKAILEKNLPGFAANPQIDMARGMTLKQVQGFAPDKVSEAQLAKIDAELKVLSAAK
ncbi:MAG TPA: hypothetical protein VF440_02690 [Novosphingobium sp.]